VTLTGSAVSGNKGISGAISNLATVRIINRTISGNTCSHPAAPDDWTFYFPGAIANFGQLALSGSTVSNNHGFWGAICNAGPLTITDSTLSGNFSVEGGAPQIVRPAYLQF
jgi:hypothetical protein